MQDPQVCVLCGLPAVCPKDIGPVRTGTEKEHENLGFLLKDRGKVKVRGNLCMLVGTKVTLEKHRDWSRQNSRCR